LLLRQKAWRGYLDDTLSHEESRPLLSGLPDKLFNYFSAYAE
jgi:hypothetical protein